MNLFFRNRLKIILIVAMAVLITFSGFFAYKNANKTADAIESENQVLKELLEEKEKALSNKDLTIQQKDAEIERLKKENEALKKSASRTSAPTTENENNSEPAPVETSTPTSSSIYDRLSVSDAFRPRLTEAIRLIESQDSVHFNVLNGQVSQVYEMQSGGGMQVKRDIYINPASANDKTVLASMIVHESQHVYNVYIDKIYSYGTKEQELPCYEAELDAAQKFGAPSYFISFLNSQIAYWGSQ